MSDGAWGTFLQQKGLRPGECPELWNVTHRDDVLAIARSYVEAGADLIETNSFGGSRFKLEKYGLAGQVTELNRAAAAISREAAGDRVLVLGSVGPTGKMLIMEEVTADEMYEAFREQSLALEAGGADAIIVETMTDLEEAVLAVRAARENTRLEVICTMTFDRLVTADYRTMMGISPAEMVQPLLEAGASIVGTNCGNGMAGMIPVVEEIRRTHPGVPILVHANAGIPLYREGQTVFPESPEEMASHVKALLQAGASIIGGCCGTTPAHIMAIRKAAGYFL
ncbi:MAG TPA: homocysteine S-methyltransferase family protein [Prolixibacteraceae bacterium]|nr:homocysteine S-methyltransferase family protein [Prolixibacteraceae bacterium]HPJ77214.1 homocysteine S-methyltransferase family protein [Prolixibacteraceae bacterium]HRV87719.1 homocysteine S-methyltransferase family protein [Prolixibacteraceae bacterium]